MKGEEWLETITWKTHSKTIKTAMKLEMRQKLAREPFAEKMGKVGQLIRLANTFPWRPTRVVWAKRSDK